MPIYEYETVPTKKGEPVKHYEIRQSMSDKPLTRHPETGEKLKKVFTAFAVGGTSSSGSPTSSSSGGCCGGSCGCHN
ncbi:MAG: FmdB family zinc ribbon protein [Puniceicoccales bacterium]